jgi:hypothetical protein
MAQRQYMRKIRTGGARFADVYRAVSEYRSQYPDKAVIYAAQKHPEMCWASLMAGGSCAAIPVKDSAFLYELSQMTPAKASPGVYLLKGPAGCLVYVESGTYKADVRDADYILYTIDAKSGAITQKGTVSGPTEIAEKGIYWLKKK